MPIREARQSKIASTSIITAVILISAWGFFGTWQSIDDTGSTQTRVPLPLAVTPVPNSVATREGGDEGTEQVIKRLRFPDGEEFEFVFSEPFPHPSSEYKPDNLAHGYHDLAVMAENGDALAATVLYRMLLGCRTMYYQSDDQLAELRNDVLSTQSYKVVDPISGKVSTDTADAEGIALSALEKSFEICRWVTDEMKQEAFYWQKKAADLGNPRQAKSYAIGIEGNTQAGRRMLRDAFLSGHYDSGTMLGEFLIAKDWPYVEENDPAAVDERASRIEGFAYYYLAVAIGHADESLSEGARETTHRDFNRAVEHLSDAEQQAGIDRAKEIFGTHPNCCQALR